MRALLIGWVVVLAACAVAAADDLTPAQRKELEQKAFDLSREGARQYQAGDYAKAKELLREALAIYRALYPKEKYPQGHPDLAVSLGNLGDLHRFGGEYAKAEPLLKEALAMFRAMYPKDRYPQGHAYLATSINNLGQLHRFGGEYAKAEPLLKEALAMYRALYPKDKYPQGHPDLAVSLGNLGDLHQLAGEYAKAEPLLKEALAMYRALYPKEKYPQGHPDLAVSLSNLGFLHLLAGECAKAEPILREALAMYRALYPKDKYPQGHAYLAISINYLGQLHLLAGEYAKAEPILREALDMCRALYPKEKYPQGHPDLAVSIGNLGQLHQVTGECAKAEPLLKEALAMYRALYPKDKYPQGHPDLAVSIGNLGQLHQDTGEYAKAEPLLREALEMSRAQYPKEKYPQGHPDLATSINNLGFLHQRSGEYTRAEPLLREALGMYRGLLLTHAELAAEAECLNYLHTQPLARDAFLSVTRHPEAAAPVYDALWDGRAALTRVLERRHRDLMASRAMDTRDLADQLRQARLTLSRRLLRPDPDLDRQRAEVQKFTDAKEDLEKRIAVKLQLAAPKPVAPPLARGLVERLPENAAFVDLYRYADFQQDPNIKGQKGLRWPLRYVAFVVRRGRPTARVELGGAVRIERAWAGWREAIAATPPDEPAERHAAAALAKLVWDPVRKELPAGLKTVYLTPDGPLHQVPWGALPGSKPDTVLLDEHAICLVPHGPFLLERLDDRAPDKAPAGTLLTVGGIDYDGSPDATPAKSEQFALRSPTVGDRVRWPALPGTEAERRQVADLGRRAAHLDVVERSGKAAGTEQLQRDLPQARYAHIATHGFFADPTFRSALQLDPKQFEYGGSLDRRGGARSPLVMSGLVFAGANRTGKDMADDRGILTAEGLIGLRLEGLELAVLSACETGLGAWGGGEGVYGLQRAFHVAGCRNVIASLWKVDDGATQALMALFYRNLWEKKLDAAEALRQAQLTLYRHPEAVQVARKRGADFAESDLPKVAEKPAEKRTHSPTAHWAAFTFSGVRPAK
jgi:CHAT domain-containing protein